MIGEEGQAQMVVLLKAAENAGDRLIGGTVLRGAPSHTGADLLRELDKLGWTLAPKFAIASYAIAYDTAGNAHPFMDGPDPFRPMYPS